MKEFIFNSEKHYLGRSCKKGHKGYRLKSNGHCCECNLLWSKHLTGSGFYKIKYKKNKGDINYIAETLYYQARRRQNKKNINMPFDITIDWILEKLKIGICEMTGLPLEKINTTSARTSPFYPSLDRKDSSKYYTKDNTRLVCYMYNIAKGEYTDADVLLMSKKLLEINALNM